MKTNLYFKQYFKETQKVNGYTNCITINNHIFTYDYTNADIVKIFCNFSQEIKEKIMLMMIKIDFNNGNMQDYIDFIFDGYTRLQQEKIIEESK